MYARLQRRRLCTDAHARRGLAVTAVRHCSCPHPPQSLTYRASVRRLADPEKKLQDGDAFGPTGARMLQARGLRETVNNPTLDRLRSELTLRVPGGESVSPLC